MATNTKEQVFDLSHDPDISEILINSYKTLARAIDHLGTIHMDLTLA